MDKISWSLVLLRSSFGFRCGVASRCFRRAKAGQILFESSSVFTYCMTVSVLASRSALQKTDFVVQALLALCRT